MLIKKKEPLVPVKIQASRPRSVVAFDLAVLPWSSQGYRYTLVVVDLFSKFVEAWPLKEKYTTSVIDGLENAWFNRHGLPDLLLSDQEKAVDGQMMQDMCRRYGIRKIHSSAYHPEGDGQSERSIQSFKTMLRCILEDRHIIHTNWPSLLQETTFILNSLPNASTTLCPHEIMFGTQLRLPLDKWLPMPDLNKHVKVQEYAVGVTQRNGELWEQVREKTEGAQAKMKQFSRSNIDEGDWVLLRKQPRNNSLSPLFDGPWIVTKRIGVNVHLRNQESGASRVVHLNKCKSIPNYGEGVNDGLA